MFGAYLGHIKEDIKHGNVGMWTDGDNGFARYFWVVERYDGEVFADENVAGGKMNYLTTPNKTYQTLI